MNIRGEKCLATKAHHQIGICCETLCDKSIVQQYIKELEDKVVELEDKLKELQEPCGMSQK